MRENVSADCPLFFYVQNRAKARLFLRIFPFVFKSKAAAFCLPALQQNRTRSPVEVDALGSGIERNSVAYPHILRKASHPQRASSG